MPHAAAPNNRPTATIETGHILPAASQAGIETDTEAALVMLQSIAPWLAKALVESGGMLDLRIKLVAPRSRRKATNVYRIQAAVYQQADQNTTLALRKEPNTSPAATTA